MGTIKRTLGVARLPEPPPSREEACSAIRTTVQAFADAWYWGDDPAMARTLHPDFLNRLVTLGGEARPLGVQSQLGALTPPHLRSVEVRVLEVRHSAASAVAELCGWVIHLHLARASGQWRIVNAMWESGPQ
jgi:hypothetical protein